MATKKGPKEKPLRLAVERRRRAEQGELRDLLSFNLAMANAVLIREVHAACQGFGISAKQFAVLSLIADNVGVSQVDIAAVLMTDRATMMAIVDRLAARKYVAREPSNIDRRRQHLILTPRGVEALKQARRAIKQCERRVLKLLKPAEVNRALAVLKQLHGTP
jgi:DNA-binding MarR family transcriptional regulator